MILVAKVVLEKVNCAFDKFYDYLIPENYCTDLVGKKVLVPFGKGNAKRQGIVFDVHTMDVQNNLNLKNIFAVLDQAPLLNDEMILLAKWMKQRYFCTYFEAINTIVPSALGFKIIKYYSINMIPESLNLDYKKIVDYLVKKNKPVQREKILKDIPLPSDDKSLDKLVKMGILLKTDNAVQKSKDAKIKMVRIISNIEKIKMSKKQKIVYDFVKKQKQCSLKEICYHTGVTKCVIDTLVKNRVLEFFDCVIYRTPYELENSSIVKKDIVLNQEQQLAFSSLKNQLAKKDGSVSLLYGVTGSGKTSVFMKLIDHVYSKGQDVIVMVPEIALTTQVIRLFKVRFGEDVAVLHSGLSLGERLDQWKKIKNKQAKIVIGTRSCVFAPFENLGLIIVDEEQEYSYKSDASPRFHAKDIARFRVKYNKAMLVLSSATPSVESFAYAQHGRYSINVLKQRYSSCGLPKVNIVDMNSETLNGNLSCISSVLTENLQKNLQNHKQSILLLNRRGYNTFASCKSCGEVICCPNCSISMIYHKTNHRLMCHYCGYSKELNCECPECKSSNVSFSGFGTQRAEQVLQELLPSARVLRMDTDTTMSKFSHQRALDQFRDGQFDIMIGTQMVAKGLDFPNVTLVGILSADQSLYSDDFRSYERAFSLFTQVIGRSGRAEFEGTAVIQTFTPENPIIKLAASQNYDKFFESEIKMRKLMLYPPFADLFVIGFVGLNQSMTKKASIFFKSIIMSYIKDSNSLMPIRIIGPSAASIEKVNKNYRFKLILKIRNNQVFQKMISELFIVFRQKREYNKVGVFFDTNPDIII